MGYSVTMTNTQTTPAVMLNADFQPARKWRANRKGQCDWCGDVTRDVWVWDEGDAWLCEPREWRCGPCITEAHNG